MIGGRETEYQQRFQSLSQQWRMKVGLRSSSASFSCGEQLHLNLLPDIREMTNFLIRIPLCVDWMDADNPMDTKAVLVAALAYVTMEAT